MKILKEIFKSLTDERCMKLRVLFMSLLFSFSVSSMTYANFDFAGASGNDELVGDGDDSDDGDSHDAGRCDKLSKRIEKIQDKQERHNCPIDPPPAICAFCGDGIQDPTEECDDGNASSADGCTAINCNLTICGDGIVNDDLVGNSQGLVEECDDGLDGSATCSTDCTVVAACVDDGFDAGGSGASCSIDTAEPSLVLDGRCCDDVSTGNAIDQSLCCGGCFAGGTEPDGTNACSSDIMGDEPIVDNDLCCSGEAVNYGTGQCCTSPPVTCPCFTTESILADHEPNACMNDLSGPVTRFGDDGEYAELRAQYGDVFAISFRVHHVSDIEDNDECTVRISGNANCKTGVSITVPYDAATLLEQHEACQKEIVGAQVILNY